MIQGNLDIDKNIDETLTQVNTEVKEEVQEETISDPNKLYNILEIGRAHV